MFLCLFSFILLPSYIYLSLLPLSPIFLLLSSFSSFNVFLHRFTHEASMWEGWSLLLVVLFVIPSSSTSFFFLCCPSSFFLPSQRFAHYHLFNLTVRALSGFFFVLFLRSMVSLGFGNFCFTSTPYYLETISPSLYFLSLLALAVSNFGHLLTFLKFSRCIHYYDT